MASSIERVFNSQIKQVGTFGHKSLNNQIKNEKMFFNCDFDFAYENGGAITRSFLDSLPNDWKNNPLVFDSRVHMLMPGWYPAIPGWHHDDVPRPKIPVGQHFVTAGQPDYDNPRYRSEHILGLLNAEICPTAFVLGECCMPQVNGDDLIYRKWHEEIERLIKVGDVEKVYAESGKLIYFDCDTFHTGEQAVSNGWRWFGRVSRNTDRLQSITNEIRVNAQVYLEFPMQGW